MTEVNIPGELVLNRQMGTVVFPKQWFVEHPDLMDVLSSTLFVDEARQSGDTDEVTITGWSHKFDKLGLNDRTPRYSLDYDHWCKTKDLLFSRVAGYADNYLRKK